MLRQLDFVVASIARGGHRSSCFRAAYKGMAKRYRQPGRGLSGGGHCGNPVFACDYEAVVKPAGKHGRAVEGINSSSFKVRPGSKPAAPWPCSTRIRRPIADQLRRPTPTTSRGDHRAAIRLLPESVGFPEAGDQRQTAHELSGPAGTGKAL